MSFGDKQTSSKSTSQNTLSPLSQQMYSTVANPAIADATQAYTPYSGQLYPSLTAQQQQAGQMAENNVGAGSAATAQGVNTAAGTSGFTPSQVQAGILGKTNLSPYLDPYTQNVVNTTNQAIEQQRQQAINGNAGQAVAAGAFGGSREGVADALTNQYYGQIGAQTDANLESQGYSNAQQAALADINNSLSAQEANQNAGVAGAQVQNTAAGILGNLGQQQQTMGANDANLINAYGSQSQQTQAALDAAQLALYQYGQQFPLEQAQALTGILGSTPYTTNNQSSGKSNTMSFGFAPQFSMGPFSFGGG